MIIVNHPYRLMWCYYTMIILNKIWNNKFVDVEIITKTVFHRQKKKIKKCGRGSSNKDKFGFVRDICAGVI